MALRVLIGTFPAVGLLDGGIRTQATALQLELAAQGHRAELFDPWRRYRAQDWDWFYLVGAHVGTVHLARSVRRAGLHLAVSPVFFSRRPAGFLKIQLALTRLWGSLPRMASDLQYTQETCRLADLVLPNTRAECDLIARGLGIPTPIIRLVPNACDERFADARPDKFVQAHGISGFVLYVGHVGLGRKRLLDLIEAMAGIDRPLVVVGPELDTEYARLCREAAQRLKDCRFITGLEHDSDMLASAYAASEVLCLPSEFETPGLAALEAGLAGTRIVITERGGTKEYFAGMAHYVRPGDRNGLRQALNQALGRVRSPELQQRIRGRFLWKHAARRLAECLAEAGTR
jgi:glycosyltransferase involved in cell wall biosynthesis